MNASGPTFTTAILLAGIGWTATNLIKYTLGCFRGDAKRSSIDGVFTILLGAGIGIALVFVLAETQWADEITVGNENLAQLSGASKALLGVAFLSLASTLYDFKKAIDSKSDARTPGLVSGNRQPDPPTP